MTLNASGPISIGGTTVGQSIEIELGQSGTAQASLNDTALRNLAGVPSGAIALSNFYGKSAFTPVTHAYSSGSGTETIPTGATTCVIEVWGGGGGGSKGTGVGCSVNYGGGGASGAYSRSSYSVSGLGGNTMSYAVGGSGAAGGTSGTAGGTSSVSSGTFSVTSMSAGGGNPGTTSVAGTGTSASGGNVANTTGNNGQAPGGGGAGGAAITGVSGAYGAGGTSGLGIASNGTTGGAGEIKFEYV